MNLTMRLRMGWIVAITLTFVIGCKKESSTSSEGSSTGVSVSSAQGGGSPGASSLSLTGNVLTYQNIDVEVPWDVSDPVTVIKLSREAEAGNRGGADPACQLHLVDALADHHQQDDAQ